jgi:ergothioneine biosynthesis protein EgtB
MTCSPDLKTAMVIEEFKKTRQRSIDLVSSLTEADCVVQSMPDASPIKWHLAHTTWFFETFVLEKFETQFTAFDPSFRVLFNSYYNGIGEKHPRAQRGLLTRPHLSEVLAYRQNVNTRIVDVWQRHQSTELATLIELGLQHEQQHQELMLTDVKHLFSCNPLFPALPIVLSDDPSSAPQISSQSPWVDFSAGLVELGAHDATNNFCFDNEMPKHRAFVEAFSISTMLVTNREYLAFIESGGYTNPHLWLAEGWDWLRGQSISQPLYWHLIGTNAEAQWHEYTLAGLRAVDLDQPVCHLSYFEADAYAHWAGARLPTEVEWELAAQVATGMHSALGHGQTVQAKAKTSANAGENVTMQIQQLFDHCWQWTSSSYTPYPGFQTQAGAIGEYNGKFMVNQYVLRGSSCFTPKFHSRISYRNFFPTSARWQVSGLRLARSI